MKKMLPILLALVLLFSMVPVSAATPITIVSDGMIVETDVAPVIEMGTTLVPVRFISEALGAIIKYDPVTKNVTISSAANTVVIKIGSKTATVNGVAKTMSQAPTGLNGRTMVPMRFISEQLGAVVSYGSNTVQVKYFTNTKGTIKAGGSSTVAPIAQAAADELMKLSDDVNISYASSGSGNGIKGAIDGSFHVGGSSRELTEAEKTANPTLVVYPIAIDGIAVIVHKDNIVKALTKDQVESIFTGETKNWKDLGGENAPIFVQTRESTSGTLASFKELALGNADVVATATPFATNGLLKEAVAGNKNAIGFVSMGYVDSTVRALSVNGVMPNNFTFLNKTYPILRTIDVITKGKATGAAALYIDFIRSPLIQQIAEKEGYLSVIEK